MTCCILLLITEVISTLWHWQINWSSCHKTKRNFDKLLAGNEVQSNIISFSKKRACCTEPMVFWNFKMFVHFLNSNHNFENTYKYNQNKTGKHLKKKLHTSILLHSFFFKGISFITSTSILIVCQRMCIISKWYTINTV